MGQSLAKIFILCKFKQIRIFCAKWLRRFYFGDFQILTYTKYGSRISKYSALTGLLNSCRFSADACVAELIRFCIEGETL